MNECTYPDCGCPEARLCMARKPNFASIALNRSPSTERCKEIAKNKKEKRIEEYKHRKENK